MVDGTAEGATGYLYSAVKDALAADALHGIDPYMHCEAISYHCQQAAEKMVKHVFVTNGSVPPKTHIVNDLLAKAIDEG